MSGLFGPGFSLPILSTNPASYKFQVIATRLPGLTGASTNHEAPKISGPVYWPWN